MLRYTARYRRYRADDRHGHRRQRPIFERIREELKAGKGTQGAVETGYSKAFGTIIDANLTTLIVSVILMTMGPAR
ncbi:MAG: hypothetical protein Ct9H300mP32_3220 [Verrucomicrobiota bacterium]|nr:MAG: hypothetical protein Ct9H300mP32_3220 [Verrucomicrobiota bacterium]